VFKCRDGRLQALLEWAAGASRARMESMCDTSAERGCTEGWGAGEPGK
jgi:hypothetical protein